MPFNRTVQREVQANAEQAVSFIYINAFAIYWWYVLMEIGFVDVMKILTGEAERKRYRFSWWRLEMVDREVVKMEGVNSGKGG